MPIDKEQFGRSALGTGYYGGLWTALQAIAPVGHIIEQMENQRWADDIGGANAELAKAVASMFAKAEAAAMLERTNEISQRAEIVYAWSAFEHLLGSCVEAIFQAKPAQLVERIETKKRALGFIRGMLASTMERRDLVAELIRTEVRLFGGKTLAEKRDYSQRFLGLTWKDEWYLRLDPVARLRHAAAHEPKFKSLDRAELTQHLVTLLSVGFAIADAYIAQLPPPPAPNPQAG